MKTIFIPIFVPSVARNVLRTDIWKFLRQRGDLRIVVFCPSYKRDFYEKEVGRHNVLFEVLDNFKDPLSLFDSFFRHIALFFVDNDTIWILRKMRLSQKHNYISYFTSWIFIKLFSHFAFLRRIARLLDFLLVRDNRLSGYFDTYRPDLIFAPHAIHSYDRAFLREARKRHITTIALLHSWDNLTVNKGTIRIHPHFLLVPNEITKKEAQDICDIPADRVIVVGMPHFDYYLSSKACPRDEFFKAIGGDPSKRLILFASIGKSFTDTEWQDVLIIKDAIDDGRLPKDLQVLVRHHPNANARMVMGHLHSSSAILVDVPGTILTSPSDVSEEMTTKDMLHYYDTLFYSDVVITVQSTVTIDAAAFDKPVINIHFDGWEKKPFYNMLSVAKMHHFTHYQPIVKSGGVRLSRSPEELISTINQYLLNPALDRTGRKKLINEQVGPFDGKAASRIAEMTLALLDKSNGPL